MIDIEKVFIDTLEDKSLSSEERKLLKQLIKDHEPTSHELKVLRSRIFDRVIRKLENSEDANMIFWLKEATKVIYNQQEKTNTQKKHSVECYFSPSEECQERIISLIKGASRDLKICVFTISDNQISEEIVKAHNRGVRVRLITDDDKIFDRGSDIKWMSEQNISIKTDNESSHMHHKFMIVDDNKLLTGSYNWTRSAQKYNQENILVIKSHHAIMEYTQEFEQLWKDFIVYS